jgi:two-component sensor histidine kinase
MRDEFNHARDRVRSMALIHEKLYQTSNLARLNFAEYAASLLGSLWHSRGKLAEKVRLTLALAPVLLSIETAVPCGMILNELAGNALKHAFPDGCDGEVTVSMEHHPSAHTVCLGVRDNGVGLPADVDWRQSSSLGLRLVRILAVQLHGTVDAGIGPGAEFQITFPLNEAQP